LQTQQLEHTETHKTETDQRNTVGKFDARTTLSVHEAGQRFSQGMFEVDTFWNRKQVGFSGDGNIAERRSTQPRYPIAWFPTNNPGSDGD
jgi:hypothetical protein